LFFLKNDTAVTLLGPAILGAILGFIAFQALNSQTNSLGIAVAFVVGGSLLVSLIAYGFRRFLLPSDKKDIAE